MASSPIPLLVIEDNPADIRLLRELLGEMAPGVFEIRTACCLAEGIADLLSQFSSAILLDLSLPDGHGLDAIDAVRKAAPETPLIVLSGVVDEEIAGGARKRGAVASFAKGGEMINDLVTFIRRLDAE